MTETRNECKELNDSNGSLNAFQIATAMAELVRKPSRKRRIKLEKRIKWLKRNEVFREAIKNTNERNDER